MENATKTTNGTGSNGTGWTFGDFDELKEKGFHESHGSQGDPRILEAFLANFHDRDEEAGNLRREIFKLNAQSAENQKKIGDFQELVSDHREAISGLEREKERLGDEKEEEIAEKKVEIRRIRSGDYSLLGTDVDPANRLAYFLCTTIILLLSVYLVLFYISVIYNAFLLDPIQQAISSATTLKFSVTIANMQALLHTYTEYGFLGATFLFTGAFMFIALGFLIHWFMQPGKSWGPMIALYAFTLLFDAFLAFEIVKKIHIANNFLSDPPVPWDWKMAFVSAEFYLILFAGFGMYVIWGFLLRYLLEEHHKIQPARAGIGKRKAEIARLMVEINDLKNRFDQQILGKRKEIMDLNQREIGRLQSEIQHFDKKVKTLRERLSQNMKKNHVSTHALQSKCAAFYTGWSQYVVNHVTPKEDANLRVKESKNTLDKFYELLDVH